MAARKWTTAAICVLVVVTIFSSCLAEERGIAMVDELERRYTALEQRAQSNATVTYMNASAPIGRFLLIRNGKDACAVRFTEFHRGGDAKTPTVFHSGDETLYAEYDWYYQGDGSGDFSKPNIKSGHEKLKRGPMVGIGRFSFQIGTTAVACGPFSLSWMYPNNVGFTLSDTKEDDAGNELAPTKWNDIREVNIHDPRLRWYRYDEDRKKFSVSIDELW